MNYIIEDNLDFKAALANHLTEAQSICLISQQPLTKSHIQLPCKHAFNYKPLYKEIYVQKVVRNGYETTRLKMNEVKCPYCRSVSEQLLPYLPSEEPERKTGVNGPAKYCMPYTLACEWQQTPTNNTKENVCPHPACYIDTVSYCKKHYQKMHTKNVPKAPKAKPTIEWTPAMTTLSKSKTLIELKQFLRAHKLLVGGTKKELVERIFLNNLVL
jgi:hypothetical protein